MSPLFEEAVEVERRKLVLPNVIEALFHRWPKQDYASICAITAHTLRHDGSSAREWQPWLALASWGSMLIENFTLARSFALLARVYPDIAKCLPTSISTPRSIDYHALIYVLGLLPPTERPSIPTAERMTFIKEGFDSLGQEDCFGLLADAISRHDWELCRTAFEQLAEFILEGRTAEAWNAELNPGYEPIPAALIAVARNAGFPLACLSDQAKDWLWPVFESEDGILPACWPFATV
jgi:hypothetical protein